MTMDESEKDDLRVIPFVCFETWRFKRTAAKLGALLLIPAALLLISVVLYCSWIAVALPLQFAVPFIAIMGAVVLCIATYCYQRVLLGLRFCVIFHRDYLQVGRGLVRRIFAYEEVDRVQAEREAGLRIGSGRNTTTVSLDSEEKADCIAVLRQCCPNALFVDEMGREHLPVSPTCPERTLTGIEHHHRRKAWLNALAGCGAGILRVPLRAERQERVDIRPVHRPLYLPVPPRCLAMVAHCQGNTAQTDWVIGIGRSHQN